MHVGRKVALCSIIVSLATASGARVEVDDYQGFCGCIILKSLNKTTNAFSAQQLLQKISDTLSTSDQGRCNNWTADPDYEIRSFADGFGKPTSNLSESAGVFAPDIYAFCGPPEFGETFSFPDFSATTAGLLLPWIAIFAQLPRQTGSNYGDLLSIFTSIGSPAWISSSIVLAVLFRRAVSTRFDRLEANLVSDPTGSIFLHLAERCEAAKKILQSFIQAPVRLNPRPGFLSSLITSPENHWWWVAAAAKIEALWRRIDAVFIVQTFIAALAWVLAIIADFWSLPGSPPSSNSSEWQICMGTLWLWVFAATFGPVAIKSLYKAKAMRNALSSPGEVYNKLHFAFDDGNVAKQYDQTVIVQKSGLVPKYLLSRRQSAQGYEINNEDGKAYDNVRIPEMWGFSIEGDGEHEGLITFPYRFFTSEQSSDHIIRSYESLHNRLKDNQVPDAEESEIFQTDGFYNAAHASDAESLDLENGVALTPVGIPRPVRIWDWTVPLGRILSGSCSSLDQYLEIDVTRFTAYPEWKDISRSQWIRFIMANLFGLVVQWGTIGPAIHVMYYSPPVGLGCDSGGLLIYAVGASLSWLLLTLGSLFTHAALLHYQRYNQEYPHQRILNHHIRTRFHTFLCGTAVITRVLGKLIAVISACWILVWSFLTYSNVMQTPYCTTAYFSLRNHGWMRLWNFDPRQFVATKVEELQCLVFGSFIAYFACVLISALTSDGKTRQDRWTVPVVLGLGFPSLVFPLYFYGVKSIEKVS